MATSLQNNLPDVINQWVTAINNHSIADTCALYAAGATLIPSMSNQVKKTAGAIEEYIQFLLSKQDFKVDIIEATRQELEDIGVVTGIYIFSWMAKNKRHQTSARFTFVVHGGKIIQHHSSVTPQ